MGYLTPAAKASLEADSRRIAAAVRPILPDRSLDTAAWGSTRVRSGMVVGSVQSGKTASMLAVCAHLLDEKADIVVILAGTRVALWMQTLERLLEKLDGSTPDTAWKRQASRELIPLPEDILSESRLSAKQYFAGRRVHASKALSKNLPVICVVPKEDDHLIELAKFLDSICTSSFLTDRDKPTSIVVLDDEADDASVLNANDQGRITPRYINRIWSERDDVDTKHVKLYATYVAYTATPQANFLQRSHNPLAPRDFAFALRVPLDHGDTDSTTYNEPKGLPSFYCGGEIFYERFRGTAADFGIAPPVVSQKPGESYEAYSARFDRQRAELLGDALRSYFVGGALRLLHAGARIVPLNAVAPMSLPELRKLLPAPHSMLFHPSALKDEHFSGAWQLARWSQNQPDQELFGGFPDGEAVPQLSVDGLCRRLDLEEDKWIRWVDEFEKSANSLNLLPGSKFDVPNRSQWPEIRRVLSEEVFPSTKVRVLNSDERADDRPRFEPLKVADTNDLYNPPPDVYTIFVAGNVLSRGLTVDGLCVSLFLRTSGEPAADTQMQMQRWFGYRGRHLPYCRLLMLEDQLLLFRTYHTNDEALKTVILRRREPGRDWADAMVLQGTNFRATSKVDCQKAPLHPGPTPSIRLVEPKSSENARGNLRVVEELVGSGTWQTIEEPVGTERGIIRTDTLSMIQIADLLERLRFSTYGPRDDEPIHSRWKQLQWLLKLDRSLFNPPAAGVGGSQVDPSSCPYSIAAYLRLWHAMLDIQNAPGLFPTDSTRLGWNMIDLTAYKRTAPQFYVAIRFGAEGPAATPALLAKGVRLVRRDVQSNGPQTIKAFWGSRGVGGSYFGDQMIDYHLHRTHPIPKLHEEPLWRPRGHPGLLLFYVTTYAGFEQPLVGLAVPHGGPDHIAALKPIATP